MIQLNYRDAKPIYEQIKDGLRRLVITGAIAKDEKLPSVRELASELESEGYIYTVSGKGSFAAEQADVAGRRNETLLREFDEIVRELLYLSEDKDALIRRIEVIAGGGDEQ